MKGVLIVMSFIVFVPLRICTVVNCLLANCCFSWNLQTHSISSCVYFQFLFTVDSFFDMFYCLVARIKQKRETYTLLWEICRKQRTWRTQTQTGYNAKTAPKEWDGSVQPEFIWHSLLVGFCGHVNEPLGFIHSWNFSLLRKDWS